MISFSVNNKTVHINDDPDTPLLWVLRDSLKLNGAKFGCGIGECGACTVHINGKARLSCRVPVSSVAGKTVITIEGLSRDPDNLHPVQQAWLEEDVPQCGYCQAGQIMAAVDFLKKFPNPSDEDINKKMTNICRCGTYVRIRKAIHLAASLWRRRGNNMSKSQHTRSGQTRGVDLSRRRFLVAGSTISGSFLLGLPALSLADARITSSGDTRIGFFINILENGDVIIGNNQPEIGQGLRTTLPMLVAEELDIEWDKVKIESMPLGIIKTADGYTWKYGGQGVGGSTGLTSNWTFMREVGATARLMLMQAAAELWAVPLDQCSTRPGEVICTSAGKRASYGELVKFASRLTPPDAAPPLKDMDDYRIVGKPQRNKEVMDIVTARAYYGIDTRVPGMRFAVIARSPVLNGTVAGFDDTATRAVNGVLDVFKVEGPAEGAPYHILAHGVAVVASSNWAAIKGREALEISWNESPSKEDSTGKFWQQNREMLSGQGQIVHDQGDFPAAIKAANKVIRHTYEVPFVSHSPLEPQNCFAWVKKDSVHIIAPTQMPSGASRAANAVTGIEREHIKVEMTRVGGGFGRRMSNDYVAEACIISKKTGWPIKLQWTREDDMKNDFYRPGGTHELTAGLDEQGKVTAWTQRLASGSKYYRRDGMKDENLWKYSRR